MISSVLNYRQLYIGEKNIYYIIYTDFRNQRAGGMPYQHNASNYGNDLKAFRKAHTTPTGFIDITY